MNSQLGNPVLRRSAARELRDGTGHGHPAGDSASLSDRMGILSPRPRSLLVFSLDNGWGDLNRQAGEDRP